MKSKIPSALMALTALLFLAAGCGPSKKVANLRAQKISATLNLAQNNEPMLPNIDMSKTGTFQSDTIKVTGLNGEEMFLMKAIKDENGEMVAHEVINAAVVTARFRNVAERHGKIEIQFQINVPQEMMDDNWQLRFHPDMYMLGDSTRLDALYVTGGDYRKAQLHGYEQYNKFLSSIISDTTRFISIHQLELFIQRNIPQIYALKTDSTFVSDERFRSLYGVTEKEAVEHYTDHIAVRMNNRRKANMNKMYAKYIKVPIETDHIRLDTVMRSINGDFIYNYTQIVETRPKLRKIDIVLSGGVWQSDKQIYKMSRSEPLTFYVSSLSAFVDGTEHFLTKVIERRASANTACYIGFEASKADVKEEFSNNKSEIKRIKENLKELMDNKNFDLDSITVRASASPEGSWSSNKALSQRRSESVANYFDHFIKQFQDSLDRNHGFSIDENGAISHEKRQRIRFIGHAEPENWEALNVYVKNDTVLSQNDKNDYFSLCKIKDPDARESEMQKTPYYKYMREHLYPKVRTVRFDFYLHRKGMVKDTVHTTELDTTYMAGVQAIKDRDYETAIKRLVKYSDYNTAVAYCALDRNKSALAILEKLPATAEVNYMKAVCYSREGRIKDALQCYTQSCQQNQTFISRGNLDPEISALIKAYGLNKQEDDFKYDL